MARYVLLVAVVSAFVFAGGSSAASSTHTRTTSCATGGLSASAQRYKVLDVVATGVGCAKARAVAREVASELANGRPIDVAGTEGMSLSESSDCSASCTSSTKVALTYARGSVTVTLKGGASGSGAQPSPGGGSPPRIV
jgi:hypothetical protein